MTQPHPTVLREVLADTYRKNASPNLAGQRFGHWVVLQRLPRRGGVTAVVLCRCDCGTVSEVVRQTLLNGKSRSCGCVNREDLTGQRFGRWTVTYSPPVGKDVTCRCDCGTERLVEKSNLKRGGSLSCGCYRDEVVSERSKTHGATKTLTHNSWLSMLSRCYKPTAHRFADYGGRGITVCDEWRGDFLRFLADMGERPSRNHSIDRVDNSKGYSPDNCRWATRVEQQNNRRISVYVNLDGDLLPLTVAAEKVGLSYSGARRRFRNQLLRPFAEEGRAS